MGSKFVSFPKPRSCETLKIPLDALANEKEISNENNEIETNLIKFFILFPPNNII